MKKLMSLLLAMVMVLSLAACGAESAEKETAETAELTEVRVAYMPNWGSLWALTTAREKGYFAEEGLDVKMIMVEEGPTEVAALDSGSIDVAYIGQGPHKLCSTGDAQVFLLQHLGQADFIIGLNGVTTLEEMRGRKVGYAVGTASETLLVNALATVDMTLDDIEAVALDATNLTAAALSGNVDAVSVWNPFANTILKEDENAVKICTNANFPSMFAPSSWVAKPEWAAENKDVLIRFSRAMLKAMDYAAASYSDDVIAEEVAGYIADELKADRDAVMSQRYDGSWLTSKEIAEGIESGEMLKFFEKQQQSFVASGDLDAEKILSPAEFVLVDVMTEAVK